MTYYFIVSLFNTLDFCKFKWVIRLGLSGQPEACWRDSTFCFAKPHASTKVESSGFGRLSPQGSPFESLA